MQRCFQLKQTGTKKKTHTPLKKVEENICTSSINLLNYTAHQIVRNTRFHPFKIYIINMFSKFLEISYCCWTTTSLYQGYDNAFQISSINNYATPLHLQASCCKPSRKILSLQTQLPYCWSTQILFLVQKNDAIMEST